MKAPIALVITCVAACTFTPGMLVGDGPVRDDAALDVMADAGQCATASVECVDDTLRQCASAGAIATDTVCSWGCVSAGPPHCATVSPAADALTTTDLDVYPTLVDLALGDNIIIDAVFGQIGTIADSTSVRASGPDIISGIYFEDRGNVGVIRVKSLHITSSMSAPLTILGPNSLAIVADGEIVIDGYVDARGPCTAAGPQNPGPGGFAGGTAKGNGAGPGGGLGATVNDDGAGGGGHGGVGGNGGSAVVGTPGQSGGPAYGDPITMLIGGSGGGGGSAGGAARGGGGGGALQLVSNTRIRILSGGINAGGCGGESKGGGSDGGAGGGAGGTLLLEAPEIIVAPGAAITANGGGAGCGKGTGLGESGGWTTAPAAGKTGCVGGDGGAGASGVNVDGANHGANVSGEPGGGGGGAVGRIRLNTRRDTGLMLDNAAILSPTLATSAATRGPATVQ